MGVNWELTGNRMGIGFVKKSYNCKGYRKNGEEALVASSPFL
jgi:hypothetical protein